MAIDPYSAYRIHDVAMSNWCSRIAFYDGKQVPNLVESPLRAFAEYRNLLIDINELDESVPISRVPLPFISIERGTTSINQSIMSPAGRMRSLGFTDESKKYALDARAFTPIYLDYRISIWSKMIQEQAALVHAFVTQFYGLYDYQRVENPPPWGSFDLPIKFGGMTESSQNDGDDDERIIQNVLRVTVEGRLFHQPIEVPTVHKFVCSIDKYNGTKDLQTTPVSELEPDLELVATISCPKEPE